MREILGRALTSGIHDTSGAKEKNSPFPAGMLAWVPADKSWSVPNKSGQELKLRVLDFKDTPGKQSRLLGASSLRSPASKR
jgi:hypothetical protein